LITRLPNVNSNNGMNRFCTVDKHYLSKYFASSGVFKFQRIWFKMNFIWKYINFFIFKKLFLILIFKNKKKLILNKKNYKFLENIISTGFRTPRLMPGSLINFLQQLFIWLLQDCFYHETASFEQQACLVW